MDERKRAAPKVPPNLYRCVVIGHPHSIVAGGLSEMR